MNDATFYDAILDPVMMTQYDGIIVLSTTKS